MEKLDAASAGERRRAGKERKARGHALSEQLSESAFRGRHRGSWDREVWRGNQREILTQEDARVVAPAHLKAQAAKPSVWPPARALAKVLVKETVLVEREVPSFPYGRGIYTGSPGCYTSAHAAAGCRALLEGLPSKSESRLAKARHLSGLYIRTSPAPAIPAPAIPAPNKRPARPGSKLCTKAPRIIFDSSLSEDEDPLSDEELLHVDPEDLALINAWATAAPFPTGLCIPEAPAEEEEPEGPEQEDDASDMSLELLDFVLIHMSDAEEEQEEGDEAAPAELPSAAAMDFSGPSSYDEGPGAATMLIERLGGLAASYHPLGQRQAEEEEVEVPRAAPAGPLVVDLGQLLELAARKPLTHKQRQKQLRRQAQRAAQVEEHDLALQLEQIREMEEKLQAAAPGAEVEQPAAASEEDEAELEFVLV